METFAKEKHAGGGLYELIVESVNPSSSVVRSKSLALWTSLVALSLVSCRGFLSELTFCQHFVAIALGSPTFPAHCQSVAAADRKSVV